MRGRLLVVLDTSARLLQLLTLLQGRPDWSGPELAERLGVTTRTVRRDVDRLRQLGYPVDAAPSAAGGYRLASGASLPPLLLDDEEATAIAVALSAGAGGAVAGIEEAALAALAKLDRVLPPRLKHRVDAASLVTLAQACAAHERVTFAYQDRNEDCSERRVEPYRLVSTGRRWYLVANDLDRRDWRTFRVDRASAVVRTGHRFHLTDPPDAAAMVSRSVAVAPYRFVARVRIDAPASVVASRVPPTVGVVDGDDGGAILTTGSDHVEAIAGHLIGLGLPFEVEEPIELREHLIRLGEQLSARHAPVAPPA
jgi:predicted DNA-binding transcriptional regulator YafY